MRVGDQISQYTIVEHIGRGGMADVWSARDERLLRTVAIKTIVANLADDRAQTQFAHEARTIAGLEHPNILPVYDYGDFERQLYIVMRYVSGGSLLDRIIDRGWLPDEETLRIGDAVAAALERAHAAQVVHRDLKPANVLLDQFGTPYLADFGLASVIGSGEEEPISSGTLMYMPPEQMFGQAVDHRADIYAFGIVIFQMVTGEFPQEGETALCLEQIQNGGQLTDPRRYRPDLPEHIVTALRIATALDASARFDSARLLMDEVKAALLGHTIMAGTSHPADFGPTQEPVPYRAETEAKVGEDMIATMAGDMGVEDLLETIAVDSAEVAEHYLGKHPAEESGPPGEPPAEGDGDEDETPEPSPLAEARRVYERMVRQWARGQGRFLTGATHFANVHEFYSQAEAHGLTLTEPGREALLRGAVEHDYALDTWLAAVPSEEARRTVLFHALRSDLASARARAITLLVDVPDGENANVALTVARLLHAETSAEVRRAIVTLLAARGEHPAEWREFAFGLDADLLLAEQALRTDAPDVAELAARAIGKLRSRTAIMHVAGCAFEQAAQVQAALAFARDEAPDLPPEVPFKARARAFGRLTAHYLSRDVGRLGLRFFTALLGSGLGLAIYVYFALNTDQRSLLRLDLLYTTIANGQTFGLVAGLGIVLAAALPLRLAGSEAYRPDGAPLWRWWGRLLAGLIAGALAGALAYLNFHFVFLRLPDPQFATALQGGIGLALGCAVASTFRWPLWARLPLAALTFFVPLYHTCFNTADPIIYFTDPGGWCTDPATSQIWALGLPLAILAALGAYGPEIIDALRRGWRKARGRA